MILACLFQSSTVSVELVDIRMDLVERVRSFRFYKRRDVSGLNKALLKSWDTRRHRYRGFSFRWSNKCVTLVTIFAFFVFASRDKGFLNSDSIFIRQ